MPAGQRSALSLPTWPPRASNSRIANFRPRLREQTGARPQRHPRVLMPMVGLATQMHCICAQVLVCSIQALTLPTLVAPMDSVHMPG